MGKNIGILTAGGDSPGLNAAIRGLGRAAQEFFEMHVIGFRAGFRGLMADQTVVLDGNMLSDILTRGGTILGTSRDKPHRMMLGSKTFDMRDQMCDVYDKHHLDVLVCLGGGGTQKNALRLARKGLNVITLPKTIDNDVAMTDVTFGFDTALGIATDAIDRLHSTAHSHHRIIVVETMGHNAGWLALGSGIAGGADVILLPEIPYDVESIAEAIRRRSRGGKRFSIVAVSEGAMPKEYGVEYTELNQQRQNTSDKEQRRELGEALAVIEEQHRGHTMRLSQQLEELTGLESRVTILGHLQRGGTPSAADRVLATQLGTACAQMIHDGQSNVMVSIQNGATVPVPLDDVVGKRKLVPADHAWISAARQIGVCLGD